MSENNDAGPVTMQAIQNHMKSIQAQNERVSLTLHNLSTKELVALNSAISDALSAAG